MSTGYVYVPPSVHHEETVVAKTEEAPVPPRFSLLGRDVLRHCKPMTLKAQHALSIDRALDNLVVKIGWGQLVGAEPSGEAELGWKPHPNLNVFAGIDSKGTRHLDLELARLAPGLTLISRNSMLSDPIAGSHPRMALGGRYEAPGLASELTVDVFPHEKSEHLAVLSVVLGHGAWSFGGRTALALTPQSGSGAAGGAGRSSPTAPAVSPKKQFLADYDVGVQYKSGLSTVFATTKQKLEKIKVGFVAAISPDTDVGALMKYDRNFRATRLRVAAATRLQDGVLRGAVDTKGHVVASFSVPLGIAVGTVVFQTNVTRSISSDSRLGLQLSIA